MEIFYVHHALRKRGNPPSQDDKILPLGIEDAETAAKIFKIMSDKSKSTFRAIYTSPYYRCIKTAEIINKHINLPIYEDSRLNEFNKVFEVTEDGQKVIKTETWSECQTRIREAIKDIVFKYNDDDVIICVTSGVNITATNTTNNLATVYLNNPFSTVLTITSSNNTINGVTVT